MLIMKKKLNSILLIDDDEAINFVHEMFIRKVGCTDKIVSVKSGKQALSFLQTEFDETKELPPLIFLDINMPAMNGWEFLDKYKDFEKSMLEKTTLIMLTSSSNPKDEARAVAIPEVKEYRNKPITIEMLTEILLQHFDDAVLE
jgi:CheY-like chemotaxis protein